MFNSKSPWLVVERPNPAATMRLFCFPYSGGSSLAYRGWQDHINQHIEVVCIEPPGRGRRFDAPPYSQLNAMLVELKRHILPLLDKPYAFFGHSNGSLVCFELARQLLAKNSSCPVHLFISGRRAPQLPLNRPPFSNLPEKEFIEMLRSFQGTPEEVLENEELLSLLVPVLRADFSLGDTYDFIHGEKLTSNLTLFCGTVDEFASRDDMALWKDHVTGSTEMCVFEGGHFFLRHYEKSIISTINRNI